MQVAPLLTLTAPDRPLDRGLLHAPGGFAWWYADVLDERHDGLVLIWSFGLPFLPGYLGAARAGRPQRPVDRPSLNVVVYERGRPVLYLLQEHAPGNAAWSEDGRSFRFGSSTIESFVRDGRRIVRARLDEPIPGTVDRLRGDVDISGPARRLAGAEPRDVDPRFHDWTPLTAMARGSVDLRAGERSFRIHGRAYHDRNGSRTPFDRLGIAEWVWGRAALRDRELVWYLLWPSRGGREATFLGAEIHRDGRTRVYDDLTVHARERKRARFGMRWWRHLELRQAGRPWLSVEHDAPIDDGPFYLRSFARVIAPDGERASATSEVCVPSRVDRPHERPFVDMRVHRVGATSSAFLPLFSGLRDDRWRRLARTLRAGRCTS